ncbi:inositol monophosphatase family protein [Corynebacterium atrinae]
MRTTAVEVATLAAERIRAKRAELVATADIRDFSTTKSSAVDPVTIVDTLAEDVIADELQRRRPADGMIGEEGHDRASISGVSWIVDPIDGTVNFLYGISEYAVSLGAAVDGDVVAGAVVNVATSAVYSAAAGHGATLERAGSVRTLRANTLTDPAQALVATGFAYSAERRRAQAQLLTHILPQVRDIRRMGAAALDLCRVAEGSVDAYYEHGINSWDYAAGTIIAREAGAFVMAPKLSTPGLVGEITYVSAPHLAKSLTHMLEEVGAFRPLNLQG